MVVVLDSDIDGIGNSVGFGAVEGTVVTGRVVTGRVVTAVVGATVAAAIVVAIVAGGATMVAVVVGETVGGGAVVGVTVVGADEPLASARIVSTEAGEDASNEFDRSGVSRGMAMSLGLESKSASTDGVWLWSGGTTVTASVGDLPALFAKAVPTKAAASTAATSPILRMRKGLRLWELVGTRLTTAVRRVVGPGTDESTWGCLMIMGSAGVRGLFNCSSIACDPPLATASGVIVVAHHMR